MEENRDLDILGGLVYNRGRKPIRSSFTIRFKDGVLEKFRKPSGERDGISFYDMVANFFIAKTEIAKKVRWREELKLAEHTAFFLDCQKAGLKVGYCEAVKINHERIAGAGYKKMRKDRGKEYGALFREMYGIREIYEDGIRK